MGILFNISYILLCFVSMIMGFVIVLAVLGRSLGIRKKYTNLLIQVFDFGRQRIDSYAAAERDKYESEDSDEEVNKEIVKDDIVVEDEESTDRLITREVSISAMQGIKTPTASKDLLWKNSEFHLSDVTYFVKCGLEAIIEDDVTQRFSAEELRSWNLLTRTDRGYHFISVRLTVLWTIGCIVRYGILLPFRFTLTVLGVSWLIISTFLVGYIPESEFKRKANRISSLTAHRVFCRAMSAVVKFHSPENRPPTGICVANHTSPIDVIILSSDNCYAMVGQRHSGFLGVMQKALLRATSHIWFERSETKDRLVVSERMKQHVEDKTKLPILIFPEGTCINNTSVMMFKKGGFEVSPVVYPVAIKYDSRFGDAFWNSSIEGMVKHLFQIMTSWAIVADVWYLPPMKRLPGEDSVSFAGRVKAEIAREGGLVDLEWDGQLKRMKVKDTWKSKSQKDFSDHLKAE